MRQKFITYGQINEVRKELKCGVYKALEEIAPWAGRFVRVCGGYHAFESEEDYRIWNNQK